MRIYVFELVFRHSLKERVYGLVIGITIKWCTKVIYLIYFPLDIKGIQVSNQFLVILFYIIIIIFQRQ
jgi:hypothetical protein